MKNKSNKCLQLLSIVLSFGVLNCVSASDFSKVAKNEEVQQVSDSSEVAKNEEVQQQESVVENVLTKANIFDKEIDDVADDIEAWQKSAQQALGIKAEPEKADYLDDTAKDISEQGKSVSKTLGTIGKVLHYAGWVVPGLSMAGDVISDHNDILKMGVQTVDILRPSNLKSNLDSTQSFFTKVKQKTFGLNAKEKKEFLEKIRDLNKVIQNAQELVPAINRLDEENYRLYEQSQQQSVDNVVIKSYVKGNAIQNYNFIFVIREWCEEILDIGKPMVDKLLPYEKQEKLSDDLKQWRALKTFVNGLGELLLQSDEKIQEAFNI